MFLPKSFFDSTKFFGISVNRSSIKAVSIDKDGKINSYAQHPLVDAFVGGETVNQQALTEGFKKIKAQGNFTTPYVAVVLPETLAFTKEFKSPSLDFSEIEEAIFWQIEDLFPFSREEIYFDWKLLNQDENEVSALVIAVPKKLVDAIRLSLAQSGLYPISFEPALSSLSRITTLNEAKIIGLIDIDQKGSAVSLVQNGVSLLTTTNIHSSDQSAITNITTAVSSLINFYEQKSGKKPDGMELLLTGDRGDEALAKTIASQTKIKTSMLFIENITPSFHQAYAAAASHIMPPESQESINLLPKDLIIWYQDQYRMKIYRGSTKVGIIGVVISLIILILNLVSFSAGKAVINQQLQDDSSLQTQSEAEFNPTQTIKNANRINSLFPEKVGPQEEIEAVLSLLPNTIQIESTTFESTAKKIQLFGTAQNRDDLLGFKQSLEDSGLFSKVSLPLGALTSKQNANFSIEFTIK